MSRKSIPFDFVLDCLLPLDVTVKPMFGMWAVYVNEKIILMLRHRPDRPGSNGVWIATESEHHASLRNELPSMCSIAHYSVGFKETEWQVLPVGAADFESSVVRVCEMIKENDHRIGRTPKQKQKRKI